MKGLLLVLWSFLYIISAAQTTYFVDNLAGNDSNQGTSVYAPLKSLERVNEIDFKPGDSLLFRRGGVWIGNFMPKGSGKEGKPIFTGDYGKGPLPELNAVGKIAPNENVSYTIKLFNQQYWEFKNLCIKNFKPFEIPQPVKNDGKSAFSNSFKMGIYIEGRDFGPLCYFHFTGLEICDINGAMQSKDNGGIFMNITWNENPELRKQTMFEDVVLQDCYIHDVDRTGFSNMTVWWNRSLTSQWGDTLANGKIHNWVPGKKMIIRNNKFERTGANALIVRATDSPLIEYNLFNTCAIKGSGNASFPFNCDNAVFQYNEACNTVYNTEVDSWDGKKDADAGGFDSDWNCKNTVIQYNYSHHNGLGGILICCDGGSKTGFNNGTILRYNVFEENQHHSIRISGPATNSKIYNNLFFSGAQSDSVILVYFKSWGGFSDSTQFLNNIFDATGVGGHFKFGKSTNNFFQRNLYFGDIQPLPDDFSALKCDPGFVNSGGTNGFNTVLKFLLQKNSPAINAGILINDNGGKDFTGKIIDSNPEIGPFEFR